MITITRTIEFDAGHRIAHHGGQCRSPHGHRYRVEVTCAGAVGLSGMLVDFGVMGELLRKYVHDLYDHAMVLAEDDPLLYLLSDADPTWKVVRVPGPPTAENFARWIAGIVQNALDEHDAEVAAVVVYETPNCRAAWTWSAEREPSRG